MSKFELYDLNVKYDAVKVRRKYPYSHTYVKDIYPRYLDPRRNEPLTILEIGIAWGGALQAFRDYLPNAHIIGYDIVFQNMKIINPDRITLVQGSQDDPVKLAQLAKEHGPFDFIIDDACHQFEPQLVSLNTLWPHIKPGGAYFIEDVFTLSGKRGNSSSQIFHHIKENWLTESRFALKSYKDHNLNNSCISFYPTLIVIEKEKANV